MAMIKGADSQAFKEKWEKAVEIEMNLIEGL